MRVLGTIMAGGKGERLYPLTKERSKPAVPFGGKYRIVDFVLSNFINSNIFSSYVLVQYMSQSLIEYLRLSWRSTGISRDHFITVVPPQMRLGEVWYRGTADAVRQNINLINEFKPDLVAVFGADHIYRMDMAQMIDFHLENEADVTISALPVKKEEAVNFGVISVDKQNRVNGFQEKPENPLCIPSKPKYAYASMGNYIFTREAILNSLYEHSSERPGLDFGKNILPAMCKTHRVFAYDFPKQNLPGLKPHEERGYWRDVGTIEALWQANMDLLGDKPKLDLNNPNWPIHSASRHSPPAKYVDAQIQDSMISDGSVITNSLIKRSILGRNVIVHGGCEVEDCVIMDSCEIHPKTRLKKVIIDRFNILSANSSAGFDADKDAQKYYIDKSGIIVIPRGRTLAQ